MANKTRRILQHNIQSIRPTETREELYTCLSQNQIEIAILQEIWLKEGEPFILKNYNLISKRRTGGFGGVEILLLHDITYEEVELPDIAPIEAVAVRLKESTQINFVSVYLPPANRLTEEICTNLQRLFQFLNELKGETIVGPT